MRDLREIKVAAAQNIKERDYWKRKLSGESAKSSFPYDYFYPEPPPHSRTIEEVTSRCDGQLFKQLMEVSKHNDHALHIILVTVLEALLGRYTGMEDITVGTPIYRQANEGEFINTALAIRNQVNPGITFKQLLVQVKQTVLEAVENQAYPVDLLPELLNLPISDDDFPLFDTALLLENIHDKRYIDHIDLNMVFWFLRTQKTIEAVVEYNTSLYKASTIERIISHFARLMEKTLSDLDVAVFDIEILSEEEKSQLLVNFNDTDAEYPAGKTIHQLFEEQAEKRPGTIALVRAAPGVRLDNGKQHRLREYHMAYQNLNEKSNQLAYRLMEKGVGPETIVGIMVERSIEMVIGVLAILKAGGAYLPIDPDYPEERTRYILADSGAKILLITRILSEKITIKKEIIYLEDYKEPCLEGISSRGPEKQPATGSLNLAYVLYTSGSTGRPKGVMVEHRNVVRLVQNTNYIAFSEELKILQTGALEFDASTFEIWGSLLNGATLYLVDKERILMHRELKAVIQKYKITTMWMTASLFNRMLEEDLEIFRGISHLLVGGEALSPLHIKRVRQQYPGLDIINGYGPTENTTFSTTFQIDREYHRSIPIGKPIANSTAYVLNGGSLVPLGVPGELVVGGDGVSRGYLNNPELTNEKFVKNPFVPGDRMYKTGDLARWLPEGSIEFLGRIDQQVKIRGFRIELEEIETQLLRHRDVKRAVVIPRGDETGDKFLCAYIVSTGGLEKTPDATDWTKFLSHTLPDYMIPLYFVSIDHIPLTSNGKVDRKALPEPEVRAGDRYTPPGDRVEEKLVELFSNLLGMEKEIVGIDTHFFKSGGHSLKAAKLISKIHKVFNVIVHIADIFEKPTINKLAKYIKESNEEIYNAVAPAEKKDRYPLSPIQKRLFIVNRMEGIGTAYNLTDVFIVQGPLNHQQLEQAFRLLIERHESFRTSFDITDGEPIQIIHEHVDFKVNHSESLTSDTHDHDKMNEIIRTFIRPFDLSQAPLLRVELVVLSEETHLFLIDTHHIVFDGTSQGILYQDIFSLYAGGKRPELPVQYKDFCKWQTSKKRRAEIEKQEQYWLNRYKKELPNADIFTDFPRPSVQSFEGEEINFTLESELIEKIYRLTKETGTTLYMVLLAVYNILLSKYTGCEDIIVGTPVAGRDHGDFENIIGVFINALPMRNFPGEERTFHEFLKEVKENTIQAYENQGYPFDNLLETLNVKVDMGRNPVFDVELVVLNMDRPQLETKGLRFIPYNYDSGVTQVDIALYVTESEEEIDFSLFFCTALFKRSTMERFISYFKEIASTVVENREIFLKDIEVSYELTGTKSDVYDNMAGDLEF